MSTPYVGEIRMFAGNFAPNGWAFCDGSLLSISQDEVLFSLIGTTYGGDGQTTFALPDLRGRLPVHQGGRSGLSNYQMGQSFGSESVTLTPAQVPSHGHGLVASGATGSGTSPVGSVPAAASAGARYSAGSSPGPNMAADAVGATGGSQPHSNLMPSQCVSFIISRYGIYPSQN